jgi:hypothetical protein
LVLLGLLAAVAAGAERYAVVCRFPPAPADAAGMPVVVTGADLRRLTGAVRPAVGSLRVALGDKGVDCQVDERDEGGRYGAGNGVLEAADEVAFLVDFARGQPADLTLSWGDAAEGVPSTAPVAAAPSEPVRLTRDDKTSHVELWAQTEQFRVGLNAEGIADPAAHDIGNFGRAAFSVVEFRGKPLTDIGSAWSNVLPVHPFGYGEGKHRWQPLAVVKEGPVRTLVTTERSDYEEGVVAEFGIYRRGPALDVGYRFRYTRPSPEEQPHELGFGYPVRLGNRPDTNDLLMVPVAGRVHRHHLAEADLAAFYPTYYETPLPEEGWFAWLDTAERSGLAVFYEPMAPIRERAAWFDSRPVSNPAVRIRTTPGGHPENSVVWQRRGLHTARSWSCANRLVGLTGDDEEALRFAYRLWAEPLDRLAEVSLPVVVTAP